MRLSRRHFVMVASTMLGMHAAPAWSNVEVRPLLVSGAAAPGTGGRTFSGFNAPTVNASGRIAFRALARFTDNTTLTEGIWTASASPVGLIGGPSPAFLRDDPLPGGSPGETFWAFNFPPSIGPDGAIVADGRPYNFDANNDQGWFAVSAPGAAAQRVLREGDAAPGIPGATLGTLWSVAQGPGGLVAGRVDLRGTTGSAIYAGPAGSLTTPYVRTGGAAPGLDGATFTNFIGDPRMNASGRLAFTATVQGGSATIADDDGLWVATSPDASPQLLVREGQPAPGAPGFIINSRAPGFTFRLGGVNATGSVGFAALLAPPTVFGPSRRALYIADPGEPLKPLAITGDAAPGTPSGTTFSQVGNGNVNVLQLNDRGQALFLADLAGPAITTANNSGLYVGTPGDLHLLARSGDAAPDAPGLVFNTIAYGGASLAANGRVAFSALLDTPGSTTTADDIYALYLAEPDGTLRLVTRVGGTLPFGDAQKTVDNFQIALGYGTGTDGLRTPFDAAGNLYFSASTDGFNTGALFVVPVPEPVGVASAIATLLLTARRHRTS